MENIKKNTDKSKNLAFICSEIIVSLNFAIERYMARYISIKKIHPFFILILKPGEQKKTS